MFLLIFFLLLSIFLVHIHYFYELLNVSFSKVINIYFFPYWSFIVTSQWQMTTCTLFYCSVEQETMFHFKIVVISILHTKSSTIYWNRIGKVVVEDGVHKKCKRPNCWHSVFWDWKLMLKSFDILKMKLIAYLFGKFYKCISISLTIFPDNFQYNCVHLKQEKKLS